mmetsp:Transcript_23802/g.20732  ORF Transcript_23802/g.20732 Transcript_23802/m.20732 type:complete len:218 (-) Transcript_23802:1273-1926(-)
MEGIETGCSLQFPSGPATTIINSIQFDNISLLFGSSNSQPMLLLNIKDTESSFSITIEGPLFLITSNFRAIDYVFFSSTKISASLCASNSEMATFRRLNNPTVTLFSRLDIFATFFNSWLNILISICEGVNTKNDVIVDSSKSELLPWATVCLLIDDVSFTFIAHSSPFVMLNINEAEKTIISSLDIPFFLALIVANSIDFTFSTTSHIVGSGLVLD